MATIRTTEQAEAGTSCRQTPATTRPTDCPAEPVQIRRESRPSPDRECHKVPLALDGRGSVLGRNASVTVPHRPLRAPRTCPGARCAHHGSDGFVVARTSPNTRWSRRAARPTIGDAASRASGCMFGDTQDDTRRPGPAIPSGFPGGLGTTCLQLLPDRDRHDQDAPDHPQGALRFGLAMSRSCARVCRWSPALPRGGC